MLGIYNPHKDMTKTFLSSIGEKLNEFSLKYENIIITPHIGSYAKEIRIQMEIEAAKNIIKYLA